MNAYVENVREAVIVRKQSSLPNVSLLLLIGIVCTSIYVVCSIFLVPEGRTYAFHFISERGTITALSGIFLSTSGALAFATFVIHLKGNYSYRWLWAVIALGFFFLALDESAQFHERIGILIGNHLSSGFFRNWNDVIVVLYGVVAIPAVVFMLPGILRYRLLLELFAVAFTFYVVHTATDSMCEPETMYSMIFEESAKLFCGLFLMLGVLISFLGTLWQYDQKST